MKDCRRWAYWTAGQGVADWYIIPGILAKLETSVLKSHLGLPDAGHPQLVGTQIGLPKTMVADPA